MTDEIQQTLDWHREIISHEPWSEDELVDWQGKLTLACPKIGDHLSTSSRKAKSRAAS